MADLYEVLRVSPSATDSEIKQSYRRRSLETHPDRFAVGSREQEEATIRFQEVNNAYYVLSDPDRRRDYDSKRTKSGGEGDFASWFNSSFPKDAHSTADEQFGSVFEEMMAEEGSNVPNHLKVYSMAGGAAGAVLGFIVANFPGALVGAVAGYQLGNVRDTKGKSVYEVFEELPQAQKAKMLTDLLRKVMVQLS